MDGTGPLADTVVGMFERWRQLLGCQIDTDEYGARVTREIADLERAMATTPAQTLIAIARKARVALHQAKHGAPDADDVAMIASLAADLERAVDAGGPQ